MKVKLVCTMYFDFWSCNWDWVKPDGKLGDDYSLLRKGSVFRVYSTPEEIKQISAYLEISESCSVICADKKGNWFGYRDNVDFEKSRMWEKDDRGTQKPVRHDVGVMLKSP